MIIILSLLIVVQWQAVYRLNRHLSALKLTLQALERENKEHLSYICRLRQIAHHPGRNAISGWLCLCAVERELYVNQISEQTKMDLWQVMESLLAIIRVTYPDYPDHLRKQFEDSSRRRREGGE